MQSNLRSGPNNATSRFNQISRVEAVSSTKGSNQRVYLILKCDDTSFPKASYVFSTFCKVLGLQLEEVEVFQSSFNGPVVWYGPAEETPLPEPGLIRIHASRSAQTFFSGKTQINPEDVHHIQWGNQRVPFLFSSQQETRPIDALLAENSDPIDMPYDFVLSSFYFLSRWEETVISDADIHGRFPFACSLAARLNLPDNIVDVYLDLFAALLNITPYFRDTPAEIPTWERDSSFVVCLTHDVDEIRMPLLRRMKFFLRHLARPGNGHKKTPVLQRTRFALSTLINREDPYATFPILARLEQEQGFTATYNFLAAGRRYQRHYVLSDPWVRDFMADLDKNGFEIGLHGSYESAFNEDLFLQEKSILGQSVNSEITGHRQHYLRMNYIRTLPIYESAGLKYDTTLGYAEKEGYRNQFSYPYHPFNHEAQSPFRFLELPTAIMDATLGGYRNLSAESAWKIIETWLCRIRARRGCLTVLWHNPWDGDLPGYFDLYPRILDWISANDGAGLSGRDVYRQWLMR